MERISRQVMWMEIAEVAAKRSTCFRGNIGAVIVAGKSQLWSIGYNGPATNQPHCTGKHCAVKPSGGCENSIHAEVNAINIAKEFHREPWSSGGVDLYSTMSPCVDCARAIFNAYIKRVFYRHPYRLRDGIDFLIKEKIEVYRVTAAGFIVSERSGAMMEAADL